MSKHIKYTVAIFTTLGLIFAGALAGAPSANAVSIYDNWIKAAQPDDFPLQAKYDNSSTGHASNNWQWDNTYDLGTWIGSLSFNDVKEYAGFCGGGNSDEKVQRMMDIIDKLSQPDSVYMIKANPATSSNRNIIIQVLMDNNVSYETTTSIFGQDNIGIVTDTNAIGTLYITGNFNSADRSAICGGNNNAYLENVVIFGNSNNDYVIYENNFQFNPPAGYEGIDINNANYNPIQPLHLKPDWLFISSAQWQGRFMDQNVATYDGISEFYTVCDDDLAPFITGTISSNNGWSQSFTMSATAQKEITLPQSVDTQIFTINGRYSCGGFGPEFDTDGVYTFTINQYGTIDNAFMENCANFAEPSIDFPQCVENVQNIIGMLSFGQLKLNKNFENIDSLQCRNLQVLGGWMFKPGAYICPQVPSYVRNIITPFILLAVGYGAASFLRKRSETI